MRESHLMTLYLKKKSPRPSKPGRGEHKTTRLKL